MARVAQIFFQPSNAEMYCSDLTKQQVMEENGPYFLPALKDKLARGVIDDSTMIYVPNVYAGPLKFLRDRYNF